LRDELRRLALGRGVTRCLCGAILPPTGAQPIEWIEEIRLPDELVPLEALATPEEARDLQDVLNCALDLLADADAASWRFKFADAAADTGPRCPTCRAPVDDGRRIRFISVSGPAPDGLLDALTAHPQLLARFSALESRLRQRAATTPTAGD